MSKTLATERLRHNLVDWANTVNDPNALPEAGAVGSIFDRQGNGTSTPTELYLRLNAGNTGWVKQNLTNLDVFNVRRFGAIGDGVTNDRAAILAAITAANAAGGGIIYFPPGSWRVQDRTTAIASFELTDHHNLVFMGDGAASRLLMSGDAGGGAWFLFDFHDGSSRITFYNLYIDGAGITNPSPTDQNHLLVFGAEAGDTLPGTRQVDVIDCYFGTVVGDAVRTIGSGSTAFGAVEDVTVLRCSFNMPSCRCGLAVQRRTHRLVAMKNFFTGSDDQNIDFEPTGAGTIDIEDCKLIGNAILATHIGIVMALAGGTAVAPLRRMLVAYNQCRNGGDIQLLDSNQCHIHGNINIEAAGGAGSTSLAFRGDDTCIEAQFTSNIGDAPGTAGIFRLVQITTGNNTRERAMISDNVGRGFGDAGGGAGILMQNVNDFVIDGNTFEMSGATVNVMVGMVVSSTNAAVDGAMISGNMVIATNQALLAGYQVAATTFNFGNFNVYGNYVTLSGSAVRLITSGGGTFVDWRQVGHNYGSGLTANIVSILSFNNGVTIEGNAGPSARFLQCLATPVGNIPSPVGSVALNTAGGEGTVFSYKETAASPTSTAGWVTDGPGIYTFAAQDVGAVTTALFLASGMDLTIASATEIQIPVVRPGTLREARLDCIAGVGGGNNTYTVRVNGANTAIAFTIANTATAGSATGSVNVVAGDLLAVQITKTLAPGTPQTFATVVVEISG